MAVRLLCFALACFLWAVAGLLLRHGITAMRTREVPARLQKFRRVVRARTDQEFFVKIVERCFAFGIVLLLVGLVAVLIPFFALDSQ